MGKGVTIRRSYHRFCLIADGAAVLDQGLEGCLLLIHDIGRKISGGIGLLVQKNEILPHIQCDTLQVIVLLDPQRHVSPSCPISILALSCDILILSKLPE